MMQSRSAEETLVGCPTVDDATVRVATRKAIAGTKISLLVVRPIKLNRNPYAKGEKPIFELSKDKVVIVTGSNGGIGSATATLFCQRGYKVVGLDLYTMDRARENHTLEGEHPALKSGLYTHLVADLLDLDSVIEGFALAAELGNISQVVSVAGMAITEELGVDDLVQIPRKAISESIAVNLTAQLYLAQIALPYLRLAPEATLAFTSSINAIAGISLHPYAAAKAGLMSLARTLAVEEGKNGIRVNVVLPGSVPTPRTIHEWAIDPQHFDEMKNSTATGKLTTVEDIATTFVALALDLKAITGQSIIVDNGQTTKWR